MGEMHKIRASGQAAEQSGEIRATPRETRMTALRGHQRLPATTGIILLYSLLYDPETRVRAIAQEQLSEITVEQISTFIRQSGHPKVLDLIARNLEKGSATLEAIASAPNLSKRTREYLQSMGVIIPEETFAPPAATESVSEKTDETDSREWTPSSPDIDLPEGVEFSMPTDEEQAPGSGPQPGYGPEEKPRPPETAPEDEAPREMEAPLQKEQQAEETPTPWTQEVEEKNAQVEKTPEPTPKTADRKLFSVHSEESKKAAAQTPAPPQASRKTPAVASSAKGQQTKVASGKTAKKSSLKRDIALAVIIGTLLGIILAAAFVIVERFFPDWPQRLKNITEIIRTESVTGCGMSCYALTRFSTRLNRAKPCRKNINEEM